MKSALRLHGARTTFGPGTQVGSAVARFPRVLLTTSAALLAALSGALAQTLEFDTDFFTSGAQGATFSPVGWTSANWWWNGALDVNWIDGSDAVFGGMPGEVTDAHVSVDDMTFNVAGYSITQGPGAGTLTFSGGTGAHVITVIGSATIGAAIAGTQGFDKAGVGPLTIATAAHTLTGTINVNAGILTAGDGFDSNALLVNLANVSGAKFIVNDPALTIGASPAAVARAVKLRSAAT